MLLAHKFNTTLKDKNGLTPIDLSLLQDSHKMLNVFKKHELQIPERIIVPPTEWP